MKRMLVPAFVAIAISSAVQAATNWTVVGWNNLGMHCMDNDFSVFSILPPYNTIHSQLIMSTNGGYAQLVTNTTGFTITYQAVADPDGSFNSTSAGKSDFWQYCPSLFFGITEPVDVGLPVPGPNPYAMPGSSNTPQTMDWDTNLFWFAAYGIPITPYDDTQRKNAYPMMRLVAKMGSTVLTNLDIVLPVSDEMDCRACHASGTGTAAAKPQAGWEWDPDPTRDYRLNILRFHDEWEANNALYKSALASNNFNSAGLYVTAKSGQPILCAACHLSEALPGTGLPGIEALTRAMHRHHATVIDPTNGMTLDSVNNRSACYRCHPGSETRCLRGAMGKAIAADGSMSMQCQSCHGSMSQVGAANRTGWLNEPSCEMCHVGNATNKLGVIRFTTCYTNGVWRTPADGTFATNTNAPASGLNLYRFSRGHGGLYCEACHGSTHAEFPSAHRNDNITTIERQGHAGVLSLCSGCHGANPPATTSWNQGPHGLHPVGQGWIAGHHNIADNSTNRQQCRTCHGSDYTGTVLSVSQTDQTLTANSLDGTVQTVVRQAWRGYRIGCYTCHLGPTNKTGQTNQPPAAVNIFTNTTINTPVSFTLNATDASPLTFRIISQPDNGSVGVTGSNATYFPFTGFSGTDKFTYAAWDGQLDSNLATGTVTVAGGCAYTLLPGSITFNELGGAASITVNVTGGNCQWTAASNHRWITLLSTTTNQVSFYIERNTSSTARYGSITVAGQTFTVAQSGAPVDANGDGIPDAWQSAYFTSASSPDAAPGADPDGDGFTNLQEYQAGTNPTKPDEALQITSYANSNGIFQVSFPTVSNKYYQVQRRDDLVAGSWIGFTNAVIGTGSTVTVSDVTAGGINKRFYRIRLVP
jgi:hypothetical protein